MTITIGLSSYLIVGAVLFCLGLFAVITRKNAIMVLMGLELILNAANINFIAFSKYGGFNIEGHVAVIFVIILAAAEAAVALAIVLNIYQNYRHLNVDEINKLKN
jgi:NADH-quinone oxidoreductase subunit K